MTDWTDNVAVITGGAGLLGRGMALTFARAGMDIVLADLNLEKAETVADEVRALGRRALAVVADVSDPKAVAALADTSFAHFGRVNVLCNNAGGAVLRPFTELTLDDWNKVLGSNLMGVIYGINAFLPRMIAQSGAKHIVNTSSMSGVGLASLRALNAPYVTSKFAVVGLTETMAPVLAEQGVTAQVLCPGMTVADPSQPMTYLMPSAQWYQDNLLGAFDVAEEVLRALDDKRLHIFPHRNGVGEVEGRQQLLLDSFRKAGFI